MKEKEKTKEEGETFVGEIYVKSKYELFGVKQKEDEDEKVISIEEIEKIKKFLSFAIRNFRKRFLMCIGLKRIIFRKANFQASF